MDKGVEGGVVGCGETNWTSRNLGEKEMNRREGSTRLM